MTQTSERSFSGTVLVTGANGFTGAHVMAALLRQGRAVRGIVRLKADLSRLQGVTKSVTSDPLDIVYGDFIDPTCFRAALKGVSMVIHTAAKVELGGSHGPEMQRVNVEGTRTVLQESRAAGVSRVVYCSTIGVLGDTQGTVVDETHMRTDRNFASAYDETKFIAQEMVDEAGKDGQVEGFSTVSVLPSGIMGPGDPHFGPAVSLFRRGKLPVWIGGARPTGIVHVEDVADALIRAGDHGESGAHYIASAGELTPREMFTMLGEDIGRSAPRELPETAARVLAAVLEPLGRLLSWTPPLDRERVHYVYDRCVRVRNDKACAELDWSPRPPEAVIRSMVG